MEKMEIINEGYGENGDNKPGKSLSNNGVCKGLI